ncbi:MAG: signal recognition particle protein, partial [Planctomycetales bacterium]|nr:signal recognition particle protein [Planctomycetales bacterium]
LELDGVIMTKLDGDARGGAALSVKYVTGVPIKFIGTGEHLDALEEFHADRMAQRILGQGDLASLVEMAQREFDQEEQRQMEAKMAEGKFTLDDFRKQMEMLSKPGLMQKFMGMMPGMSGMREMQEAMQSGDAEREMRRLRGMIDSMTLEEKRNPKKTLDQSRRRRIAAGSGVEPHEVNEMVKQFEGMASMMEQMAGKGMRERMQMARQAQAAAMNPAGLAKLKKGTGKRLSNKEKAKLKKEREKEKRRRKRGGG